MSFGTTALGGSSKISIASQISGNLPWTPHSRRAEDGGLGVSPLTQGFVDNLTTKVLTPGSDEAVMDNITEVLAAQTRKHESVKPFRFLDLPSEIRNMVYQECVVVGDVYLAKSGHTNRCCCIRNVVGPQVQLFSVNNQVLREAGSIFFAENRFRVGFWHDTFPWRKPRMQHSNISKGFLDVQNSVTAVAQGYTKSVVIAMDLRDHQKMMEDRLANENKRVRESFAEPSPKRHCTDIQGNMDRFPWSQKRSPSIAWVRHNQALKRMKLDRLEISLEQCYCVPGHAQQLDDRQLLDTILRWKRASPKTIAITGCRTVVERERLQSQLSNLPHNITITGPSWDPDLQHFPCTIDGHGNRLSRDLSLDWLSGNMVPREEMDNEEGDGGGNEIDMARNSETGGTEFWSFGYDLKLWFRKNTMVKLRERAVGAWEGGHGDVDFGGFRHVL